MQLFQSGFKRSLVLLFLGLVVTGCTTQQATILPVPHKPAGVSVNKKDTFASPVSSAPASIPVVETSTLPVSLEEGIHIVQPGGETLYSIAIRYGQILEDLAAWNNLAPPYYLREGQRLVVYAPFSQQPSIPEPVLPTPSLIEKERYYHVVLPGDELEDIAKHYNVSVDELSAWNNLQSDMLSYGQELRVIPPDMPSVIPPRDTTPPSIVLQQKPRGVEPTLVTDTIAYTLKGQAIDESGIASITVNGKPVEFNDKGYFSAKVQLQVGDNPIRVTATDTHNNTAHENITLTRAETPPPPKQFAGNYHALVIGINRYQQLSQLHTAVNDAREVAQVLKDEYGFTVKLLLDGQATRDGINRAFNQLNKALGKNDHLLIYYAGHGYYDKDGKTAYWLPIDAETDDDTKWVIADRITSHIRRNPAKNVLIVSDSCYSGTLTRGSTDNLNLLKTNKARRQRYLKKMNKKPARVLIASGGNEPVTDSGGKGHSIFAQAFLDGLREMEAKAFTAEELFVLQQIKERVAGKVAQTPEFQIIRESGHDGGDFVFQRR